MNILIINYEYPPVGAGAATAARHIATELACLGNKVTVVAPSFGGLRGLKVEDGVRVRRIEAGRKRRDRSGMWEMFLYDASAAVNLPALLDDEKPRSILVFFSMPCGPLGLMAKWLSNTPYIISLRGGDVPGAEPGLATMHSMLAPLRRMVLRNAAAVVANSKGLREMSEKADRIPVSIIPNGVDTAAFSPASRSGKNSRFRMLFVGRFQRQKNLTILVKAAEAFSARTRLPFVLEMVGDGPDGTELKKLALDLGIERNISWRGWLKRDELADVYRNADVFVNPSLYEGMPNAVLEAMASGLPIVASRVGGNDELVINEKTGLLFESGNVNKLTEALIKTASDTKLSETLGTNARNSAVENYSWRRTAEAYSALMKANNV